jgi:rsbT co-antagonist protein RsbR
VPIIGAITPARRAELTNQLLTAIVDRRARAVVLDLTGVEDVELAAAELFGQIVRVVQLLGAVCAICGIQPHVARIMTHEHLDVGGARVYADMEAALAALR